MKQLPLHRTICCFLAVLLASGMISCSSKPSEETLTSEAENENNIVETEPPETELIYPIEAVNYNGRNFTVWSVHDRNTEFYAEEFTGSVENDATYERNLRVSADYNIVIAQDSVNYDIGFRELNQDILAGELTCDLINTHAFRGHTFIMNDLLQNWNDVSEIDMNTPWWHAESNDGSTFNGILYLSSGAANASSLTMSTCIFYNMNLLDQFVENGTASVQQTVLDGKWTLDVLKKYTDGIYVDLNGDGAQDMEDRYGFMAYWSCVDPIFTTFGESMTGRDENGNLQLTYLTEKSVSMYEKMYQFIHETPSTFAAPEDYHLTKNAFITGHTVFAPGITEFAKDMGDMEDNFGILPYPKWDEAQKRYYTMSMDSATLSGIPLTADLEFAVRITDVLHYYSYKDIVPVYLDTMLKGRYSADPKTAEIIDTFINNRKYEFAVQFSEPSGRLMNRLFYMLRDLNGKKDPNLVSRYEAVEEMILKEIENIMGHYTD